MNQSGFPHIRFQNCSSRNHWQCFVSGKFTSVAICLAAFLVTTVGCNGSKGKDKDESGESEKRIKIAFVTNCIADFWTYGEAGAKKAGEDFDCDVEVRMPPDEGGLVANQKRIIEQLLSKGVDGVAISPRSPANQLEVLNELGRNAVFITHDSDAPQSNRLLYIGMSNYDAGRMVGEMVKEAIPDGGNIVIFVGTIEQDNGRLRRQGVIDEVLGRSHDPKRFDKPGSQITEGKYTILETRIDNGDGVRKKEMPETALVKYDKIDCMVGLFAYNPTFILDALDGAGKLGQIKVVGFDEDERTLDEIKKGNCVGTVVQNPYMYGYKSVEILCQLVRKDMTALNKGKFLDIPARKITAENVDEFRAGLKAMMEGKPLPEPAAAN